MARMRRKFADRFADRTGEIPGGTSKGIMSHPVLPGDWNPPGQFGRGPEDIKRYYPRSDATAVEMGSGRMNLDSAGNFMDPPAMDWYGENRPMQKTSWWPTKLGNRYRNEAFNERMGVNMSGYRDDEFGGFGQNYGNPHLDRINPYGGATPWEETGYDIFGMGTGDTSEFFPPLTIGDLPTSEFGEEKIQMYRRFPFRKYHILFPPTALHHHMD